ncbi:MAG TPA: ABC transporter permease [Candidatus Udaeobacter sp.]|jgi:ABC-type nitrate/sulfonate/bicarbonate transport system permease component|nr:ABC transporter permease [Candidatus Udaeobacter sp.]
MVKATQATVSETARELKPARHSLRYYYLSAFLDNFLPLAVILLIWEGVARLEIIHPALFPTVTEIFAKMWELTLEGIFLKDVLHSLTRLLSSVFFAIIVGTLAGLLMGTSRWVEKVMIPPLNFFLAIPGIAIFPIVILWFGLSEKTIVFTLAFEASLSIMLNTWAGVKGVDSSLMNAGRALGAKGYPLFYKILIPAALPAIITGYRQGFSRAWRILVAGEMLASIGTGIGFRIFEARAFLASDVMYAGVIVIGVLGFLLERVALRSLEIFTVQRWGMVREL